MRARTALAALALAGLAAGCGRRTLERADTARIVDAIKTDEVRANADFKAGDAARVAAHLAPSAIYIGPGGAPLTGPAIRAALENGLGGGGASVSFASDKVDVAASGDLAAARGVWRLAADGDPQRAQSGGYVAVYKPDPGHAWRAVWVIATPDAAPTAELTTAAPEPTAGK